MKKALLIFFALQLFSANSFAEELGKISSLFIHFEHHLAHEKNQSFTDFIANHYFGDNYHDSEPDHEHLPLKHCTDHCQHQVMPQSIPTYFYFSFSHSTPRAAHVIHYETASTTSFPGSIFQPPRLV